MKIHYMSCAESSSVDSKTNQLSLFHVMDEIAVQTFPMQLTRFCVASLFEREPGDAQEQQYVLTISLDDRLLASFTMRVDFGQGRRNRSVNTINGMAIPGPGALTLRMSQKATSLAEWHVQVLQIGAKVEAPKPAPVRRQNEMVPAKAKAGPTVN